MTTRTSPRSRHWLPRPASVGSTSSSTSTSGADGAQKTKLSWSGYLKLQLAAEAQAYADHIKTLDVVQKAQKEMAALQ
jgi:hypothetical protein